MLLNKQGQTVHRSEALNFNVERIQWRRHNDIERKVEKAKERANNKLLHKRYTISILTI